jgi:nucleoside-diphosphate-sugar epimerase
MTKKIGVVGANGFVGRALVNHFTASDYEVTSITRENFIQYESWYFDILIDAAGNSKKFIADENLLLDFDLTVRHRMQTLLSFNASLHVHISSVDVYHDLSDPEKNTEEAEVDLDTNSNYGFTKRLAELIVQRHAPQWLIFRLSGMVGPGLRKNPVYDIANGVPIRINPKSSYQFCSTEYVANLIRTVVETGVRGEIINVAGRGQVTPHEIAKVLGKPLFVSPEASAQPPRIVSIGCAKADIYLQRPSSISILSEFSQRFCS